MVEQKWQDSIQYNKNNWVLEQNNAEIPRKTYRESSFWRWKVKKISQAARKRAEFFSKDKFGKSAIEFFEMLIEKYNSMKKD